MFSRMATAVLTAAALITPAATTSAAVTTAGWVADPPIPVGGEGFGVDIVGVYDGRMPTFDVGAVRFWDDRTRWSYIEKQQGVYDWTVLDALVAGAEAKGLPVLYTMGQTPRWANPDGPRCPYEQPLDVPDPERCTTEPPDDLAVWDAYVRQVVTRYQGRIQAYELWNEATTTTYFGGTVDDMVAMARRAHAIIKSVDPAAIVVSPSATMITRTSTQNWVGAFAAKGGYAYADRVAVHLYTESHDGVIDWPERSIGLVATVRSILSRNGVSKPLWDTETAEEPDSDKPFPGTAQQAADWVSRYLLMGLYNRLGRSYFYGWGSTGLALKVQDAGAPPTPAGAAMAQLLGWMRGAAIRYCGHGTADGLPPTMWQCGFAYGTGEYAVIRWTDSGTVSYGTGQGTYEVERIGGQAEPAQPGQTMTISGTPVIVRYHG